MVWSVESYICENNQDSTALTKVKIWVLWDSFAIARELMAEGDLTFCKLAVCVAPQD
jgi:hypothetical protein